MSDISRCSSLPDLVFPSILEGLAEPAIIIDTSYMIVGANQAYRDVFADGGKVCGLRCHEVSHCFRVPCHEAGEDCPLESAKQTGARCRSVHVHHTSSGEEHENVTVHPLFSRDGDIEFFLEILAPATVAHARPKNGGLVGRSPAFNLMLQLASKAAPASTTVLLLGESGTGKELVAKAIHDLSRRSQGPFVPVDCSGLTESLFESELFGHEKGAFTGAYSRKRGLVEAADGGTLFLDEIGDIPLSLQVKLLRLLETGVFRRVGSVEQLHSDFRLVCATHRDLSEMTGKAQFRSDLYYRISSFPIRLPPLRDRPEDIPLLVEELLDRLGNQCLKKIHPDVIAMLQAYSFPGNVRELQNMLERACLLAEGDTLLPEHLPPECRNDGDAPPNHHFLGEKVLPLEELETRYLSWVSARFPGDRTELAEQLGLSERTLYRKLSRLRNGSNGQGPSE